MYPCPVILSCSRLRDKYTRQPAQPSGVAASRSPEEIARQEVRGKSMPWGYGSGIQDIALENGQVLFALCEAYDAIGDEYFAAEVAHDKDYVASVVAYHLGLTGPAEVVQAACSSSLVAAAIGAAKLPAPASTSNTGTVKHYFDAASGAWYVHNAATGETRWDPP